MVLLLVAAPFSCTKPDANQTNNTNTQTDNTDKTDEGEGTPQTPVLNSISVNPTEVTLEEGATKIIALTINPADYPTKELTWSSSAEGVATVVNGIVTAVAHGEATIKASLAGKEASCKVTVTKKEIPEPPAEWDGKTFTDRTADWETAFVDYGSYWLWEVHTITTPYYHVKYIMEDEDFLGASEAVRKSPIDIKAAYEYFCVNVDESFLMNALKSTVPGWEELVWPEGYGHAQGYVFGFDKDKKFTGEYAHVTSEHVF